MLISALPSPINEEGPKTFHLAPHSTFILRKNSPARSPNIQEEVRWLRESGALYYPVHGRPLRASAGCWLYFVRDGAVAARARVTEILRMRSDQELVSYGGVEHSRDGWQLKCEPPMDLATNPVPHASFQGFRYVTPQEKQRFEKAFSKRTRRKPA